MSRNDKAVGILLVAISAVSYGLLPVLSKMAYAAGTSIYTMLFLRFSAGAAFMFALIRIKRLPLPTRREIITFLLLGAIGYVGQSLCYFLALDHASASVVALLLYAYPALVMVGSVLFFKEKVTAGKVLSLCLALTGAAVIVGTEFRASPLGIVLAVASAVGYSIYILINARVAREGMGIQSSAFIMLGAAAVYGLLNVVFGFTPPTEPKGYVAVALIALVSTVVAFWSFLTGMQKTGPSTAALVSTLEPVVVVVCSVLILSEKLTANVIIGGCLVLAALVATALPGKKNGE